MHSLFFIVILCILLFLQCNCGAGSKLKLKCGENQFYCLANSRCVARRFRCPLGKGKLHKKALGLCSTQDSCMAARGVPSNAMQALLARRRNAKPNTAMSLASDRFYIVTAFSPIYSIGSRSRRGAVQDAWRTLINDPWQHSFVQFRGFVYEYGSYGVQELDINDPQYKYNTEPVTEWTRVGTSACKHKEIRQFLNTWRRKRASYSWYSNNCHAFTKALVKYLKDDCKNLDKVIVQLG